MEIPHNDQLAAISCKSIKVKLEDKDGKELVGHYFDNTKLRTENEGRMKIPPGVHLKNYKLQLAIKESHFMFGEKNIFKTEVSMHGLGSSNETIKAQKFDKVKFDVIIRTRQAANKAEKEIQETRRLTVTKIHPSFQDYFKEQNAKRRAQEEAEQ